MALVLMIDSPPDLVDYLSREGGTQVVAAHGAVEAHRALLRLGGSVDLVLVGGSKENAMELAERIRVGNPRVHLALVTSEPPTDSELGARPLLGMRCPRLPSSRPRDVLEGVRTLLGSREKRRRGHKAIMEASQMIEALVWPSLRPALNLFLDQTPLPIFILDPRGEIMSANREASLLLEEQEIRQERPPIGLLFPSLRDQVARVWSGDERLGQRHFQLTLREVPDFEAFILVAEDVTDLVEARRQAEAALRRSQLSERQSRRDRDAAIQADRLKTALLANVSHELRTPLASIRGLIDLLRQTPLATTQTDFLESIAQASESLLTVVSDLLDLSSLEAGKLELAEAPFEPRAVLRKLCRIFEIKAQQRGLTFDHTIAVELPQQLVGDSHRWSQMILNFLTNAFKFTKTGGVRLSVLCSPSAGGSAAEVLVRCEVEDTGPGVPEDKLDRLFLPFSQVDSSASRPYGGTGLGLSIVKRLAESMRGRVGMANRSTSGALFWFETRMGTDAEQSPVEATAAPAPPRPDAELVLAEDNPINRKILRLQLEKLGYRVRACEHGQEALSLLAADPCDLVILDCQMPVMDGYEAARRIRAEQGPLARVPIIALTAHAFPGERERCLAAGMSDFLTKPISADELDRAIRRNLGEKS
jgi:signal transduction histidine kinase/CheY-like chemotaxis protein